MRRKNRVLDPARPFGEIRGGVCVLFSQGGLVFNHHGKEVVSIDDPTPLPEPFMPEYHTLPIIQIKRLVEKAGGEYQNKSQGILFLQGLNKRIYR